MFFPLIHVNCEKDLISCRLCNRNDLSAELEHALQFSRLGYEKEEGLYTAILGAGLFSSL